MSDTIVTQGFVACSTNAREGLVKLMCSDVWTLGGCVEEWHIQENCR